MNFKFFKKKATSVFCFWKYSIFFPEIRRKENIKEKNVFELKNVIKLFDVFNLLNQIFHPFPIYKILKINK